ncbi:hypothetical protein Bpfe_015194, partial [Biomphalaria pfeifferi]
MWHRGIILEISLFLPPCTQSYPSFLLCSTSTSISNVSSLSVRRFPDPSHLSNQSTKSVISVKNAQICAPVRQ